MNKVRLSTFLVEHNIVHVPPFWLLFCCSRIVAVLLAV